MAMAISVPRYTIADLQRFPDDGNRYELLDGVLIVTPSPSNAHQIIVSRSSRVYDREIKRDAYVALGVQEVWLVDRWNKVVEVSRTRGPGKIVEPLTRPSCLRSQSDGALDRRMPLGDQTPFTRLDVSGVSQRRGRRAPRSPPRAPPA